MKLRDYQIDNANKLTEIISKYKIAYFQAEVRTGKTLTALESAKLLGKSNVLFITKLKAISSIISDFEAMKYTYKLNCINKESLHKIKENDFDFIIIDEAHQYSSIPKPSKYTLDIKKKFSKIPMLLLSGTPTPENYSQIFHQFWISNYSPFKKYVSFYKWSKEFVNITQKQIGAFKVNDYSDAKQNLIKPIIEPYIITFTQEESGFKSKVNEHIIEIEMHPQTSSLIYRLKKDKVIEGNNEIILAETGVKLMQKVHQLSSGTVKFESGKTMITDFSKITYIKEHFKDKKIAIIYKYKAERDMLIESLIDNYTESIEEFNNTNKWFIGQITSTREGTNLSKADCLVFMNLDFSATSYWQCRDRMTTKDRPINDVYFIFGIGGIEKQIYNSVMHKKDFTLSQFRKL